MLQKALATASFEPRSAKLPFPFDLKSVGPGRVNMTFHIYPPSIAVVTLAFDADRRIEDLTDLLGARSIIADPILDLLVRTSLALINSEDHRQLSPVSRSQAYPCFRISGGGDVPDLSRWDADRKREVVGVLIGNVSFATMSADIIDHVSKSNSEFNKKRTDELLLVDKQGLLLFANHNIRSRSRSDRFARSTGLVEVALVMRAFLRQYPSERAGVEEFSDYVFWRIRSWVRRYPAIFSASVGNRYFWEHLITEFRLRELVDLIEADNQWIDRELKEKEEFFTSLSGSWWLDRAYANNFEISGASPAARELGFVTNTKFRMSILSDLREADRALHDRSFKSAVVMAGAIAEALLLEALMNRTVLDQESLLKQGLSDYVKQARSENLGLDEGVLSIVDQAMRGWRNLVHPGRQIRLGASIDEHKAKLANTAIHALAAELSK
ncbi:hypothetical protein ACQP2E_16590 [Actinoplanes sp. CA-015351]|uniref:hypothetical protein n=1 Tax=Actinoplanes sp. CA-015351 TaxID=3239897 RepID=UPI003D96D91E